MDTTTPTVAAAATGVRRLADLPAPRGLPLLGNLHQLDIPRLHQVLEDWHAQLGSPYRVQMGPKTIFVTALPETMHTVCRERPERYRRMRQIEDCLAEMGGNGVFSAEGEAWRPQRKLVMSALASTHFRSFFPTLEAITQRLHRRWAAAADEGRVLDMSHELVRYTVDVTTALAFGEDPNTIERDGDVIQDHLARVFPALMARVNGPLPYWRWVKLPRDRELDKALAAIHRHIDGLILHARQRLHDEPATAPRNLLEALLLAQQEQGSAAVSDEVIRANVFTLLLAGEDTTAHTLAWTLFVLAQHPAWQQRLHDDAREVQGDAAVCAAYDELRRLDLFEHAANEATRLKPTVAFAAFEPNEDVVLEGVALPRGTPMFFVMRPATVDATRFADPQRFDPERWGAAQPQPHDARAWLQFGFGARVCPGRHLAAVEIRLVLAMLMRSFRVELACDPAEVHEVMAFTMMPSRMPVRLHALS